MSLRDLLSSREGLASRNALLDLGLARSKETISRWEAGPSWASGTGSVATADATQKRKKHSPEIFEGDAALKELRARLAATPIEQIPEPPLAPPKTAIFTFVVRLIGVVGVAAGGGLGFLWIISPHGSRSPSLQAGKEVELVSQRETPKAAPQKVVAERAADPSAAAAQQPAAAGAALYQDFLKWRQLQGR